MALHHNPITFNVSHSNRLATYAVGLSRPVGIDIEYIRETPDTLDAIYHCLADEEREQLSHVPASRRAARLFAYWASKEAFLKATGRGLQIPPSSVVIQPSRKQSPALCLTCRGSDALTAEQWMLSTLDVHPEFAGSVCARGAVESYSYWEWSLAGGSGVAHASR